MYMGITREEFGTLASGEIAYKYVMTNSKGTKLVVTNYGANLLELHVADKDGKMADVVLGYDKLEDYFENGCGFGACVGQNANRIGGASFELNGVTYPLEVNDGKNNLHSAKDSFQRRLFRTTEVFESVEKGDRVNFYIESPHMDMGFPGNVALSVTYTLTEQNEVKIHYGARSDEDTIINMTNHSYFNLAGHNAGSALDQRVWIDSDEFTITDEESIPTGELVSVKGTPMDFNELKAIGAEIDANYKPLVDAGGYDHNYVLKTDGELALVASMQDDASGRLMNVYTDLPGLQFYTGNYINNENGKGGVVYTKRTGICFESQYYPDAIHHAHFPQPVTKKGENYNTTTIYEFSIVD